MANPGSSSRDYHTSQVRPALVEVRDNGITQIYEPVNGPVQADVIFVHGLQGHPRKTWAVQRDVEKRGFKRLFGKAKPKDKAEGVATGGAEVDYWPEQLLPLDQQNVRILTYGYDSHVTHGFAEPNSKNGIFEHGGSFLRAVGRHRTKSLGRPIIFVAHSLGGLVVKQALIEARKQADYDKQLYDVYVSTYAVIFLGTPHRGAGLASWGSIIGSIAQAALVDANRKILKELVPSGTSKLQELRLDFEDVIGDQSRGPFQPLRVFTFQEELGMSGVTLFGGKVVPDESSSLDNRAHGSDTIHANHMNMCRFASRKDDGYEKFQAKLAQFVDEVEEIARKMAEKESATEAVLMEETLNRLDFPGRLSRQDHIRELGIEKNTLDWIWDTKPRSEGFSQWIRYGSDLFWICGKPASGKSTLIDFLSEHPTTRAFLDGISPSSDESWTIIRFFFDFRSGTQITNNLEGFIRSLLFQVMKKLPNCFSHKPIPSQTHVRDQKSRKVHIDTGIQLNEKDLCELLFKTLDTIGGGLCIFVDGLDEYDGSVPQLIRLLRALQRVDKLKLCVASRPSPMFLEAFDSAPGIRMQDYNRHGIGLYVSQTVNDMFPSANQNAYIKSLCESISRRAEGVFLWARFATAELIDGYCRGDRETELLARLDDMPQDLEQIYARIIDRFAPKDRKEGILSLLIAGFAARPMALEEFYVALGLAMGHPSNLLDSIKNQDVANFSKRVQARTGGLLEVIEETGSQQLVGIAVTRRNIRDDASSGLGLQPSPPRTKADHFRYPSIQSEVSHELSPRQFPDYTSGTSSTHLGSSQSLAESASAGQTPSDDTRMSNESLELRTHSPAVTVEEPLGLPLRSLYAIKIIHRTVATFLERGHIIRNTTNAEPHAVMLAACVEYLELILPALEPSPSLQGSSMCATVEWMIAGRSLDTDWHVSKRLYPFFYYAATHVFTHAMVLEAEGISSYSYLCKLPAEKFLNVHSYISNIHSTNCPYCVDNLLSSSTLMSTTAFGAAARHGLLLYCEEALRFGHDLGGENGKIALSSAICFAANDNLLRGHGESKGQKLVMLVLDNGAEATFAHLKQAFREAPTDVFRSLLGHMSQSASNVWIENSHPVQPLWLFAKFVDEQGRSLDSTSGTHFGFLQTHRHPLSRKLEIMIESGEKINDTCGPDGNVLQSVVYDFVSEDRRTVASPLDHFFLDRCECLVKHGANVNLEGPHGTPMEMLQRWVDSLDEISSRSSARNIAMGVLTIFLKGSQNCKAR